MRNITLLTLILVSTSLLSNPYHHAEAIDSASHGLLSQEFGNRLLRRYGGNLEGDGWFNKRYPGLQERAEGKKLKDKNEEKDDLENNLVEDDPRNKNPPKDNKKPVPDVPKDAKRPEPGPPKEVVEPDVDKEVKKPVPLVPKKPKKDQIKEVKDKPDDVQEQKDKEDVAKGKGVDDNNNEPIGQNGTPTVQTGSLGTSAIVGLVAVGTVFAAVTGLFAFVRRKKNKEMTKSIVSTSANAWETQNSTYEVMDDVDDMETKPVGSYTVVATYTPALADELDIQPGDRVTILVEYDDGWVQGINETRGGAKGVFPRHCVDMNVALNDKRSSSIGGYTIVDLN